MPSLLVAGNWKMNTTVSEAAALAAGVRDGAAMVSGVELVLCPPAVSLVTVGDAKPRYRRETPEKPKPDPSQPKERKRFLGLF